MLALPPHTMQVGMIDMEVRGNVLVKSHMHENFVLEGVKFHTKYYVL